MDHHTASFDWRSRLRAATIHLGLSAIVAVLAALLVFALWYPWPYGEISGGRELFRLVVAVDVVLGPLITFTIFNRAKPRRELRRDLAVVVLLQLAGLGYGLWTVQLARPVHLVYELDRFRVVHQVEIPEESAGLVPAGIALAPPGGGQGARARGILAHDLPQGAGLDGAAGRRNGRSARLPAAGFVLSLSRLSIVRRGVAATLATLLLAAAPAGGQLPALGDAGDITSSAERKMGERIARELYRDPDYIDDPELVEYVQSLWQPLLAAARARGELTAELDERFAWQVLLGKDRTINAFALPPTGAATGFARTRPAPGRRCNRDRGTARGRCVPPACVPRCW